MDKFVTRYAPSPTGPLHIGGIRTALFCFLLARHRGGKFIIRTEDTDQTRNKKQYYEGHIRILNRLGIQEDASILKPGDDGPYLQSKRYPTYHKCAQKLLEQQKVYFCFCTKEDIVNEKNIFRINHPHKQYFYSQRCRGLSKEKIEKNLKAKKKYTIRFLNNLSQDIVINDLVYKKIIIKRDIFNDFIIMKSNGSPNYNFACVIDDTLMNVTHVLRGSEHLSNTGKQIILYNALGFKIPEFVHISLIINKDKKKLSKRDPTNQSISQLLDDGILPASIINFAAFLGWKPNQQSEIFSLQQLVKLFNLQSLSKSPAVFDLKKLYWFNKQYISQMNENEFAIYLEPIKKTMIIVPTNALPTVSNYLQTRVACYTDIQNIIEECVTIAAATHKSKKYSEKFYHNLDILKPLILEWLVDKRKPLDTTFDAREMLDFCRHESKLSGVTLYMPIRLFLNNRHFGISIDLLIIINGKDQIIKRLKQT